MDKLVARYTRSPHQDELQSEQEERELTESLPPLTLRFNLPPLANVSFYISNTYETLHYWLWLVMPRRVDP